MNGERDWDRGNHREIDSERETLEVEKEMTQTERKTERQTDKEREIDGETKRPSKRREIIREKKIRD